MATTVQPYGYDPDTDTVRVSRHDLARLLLQFREERERDSSRNRWSHMHDFDISFERLADAVDYARSVTPYGHGSSSPDDRMRCKRTTDYDWPDHAPYNGQHIEALRVASGSAGGGEQAPSHHAYWDSHGFGHALCGFTFTEEDGVAPVSGEPSCRECAREKRMAG